eukprot:m.59225 g.59225  ORF g.59225 m.59225 type:complete len:106 (-) comp11313_c0_seq5:738-1055(-)
MIFLLFAVILQLFLRNRIRTFHSHACQQTTNIFYFYAVLLCVVHFKHQLAESRRHREKLYKIHVFTSIFFLHIFLNCTNHHSQLSFSHNSSANSLRSLNDCALKR